MVFSSLRRTYLAIIVLLSFFLSYSVEAITLTIADNLQLRELNDERVNDGFFDSSFFQGKTITLPQGNNTLLIKYKDVYEDIDFAEERLVESEYFIVKFNLTNQQTVKLQTPKIKNLSAAERFSLSPEIMLVDERNSPIVLVLEKHSDYKLAKQVEKVMTTLPEEVSPNAIKKNVVKKSEDKMELSSNIDNGDSQDFREQVLTQTKSFPMLKYWWDKASKQEKDDFILYIKEKE